MNNHTILYEQNRVTLNNFSMCKFKIDSRVLGNIFN